MRPGSEPFGDALRRLREAAGLTQEQLAERAGLSFNAISSLERGERQRPYPHTVDALATALDLSGNQRASLLESLPSRGQRHAPPYAATPLIGRQSELQAIADIVEGSDVRLLTLIGPGGVGKTRLALAAAEMLSSKFRDGVAVIALSPVRDPALVVATLVRGLDLRESGSESANETLNNYVRRRAMLLVLDNMEHLLAAAPDIASLLAAAPRVKVLCTSRSPMGLDGERLFAVPPLSEPAAIELFLQRAAAQSAVPSRDQSEAVAAICARLDFLPLAIELAAAQTRVLPPSALLSHLERGSHTLTSRARDVPERHRSLRDTIAWSHDLLEPAEQRLFRQLSVCAGSWTLDAGAALGGVDEWAAVELHRSLIDASLVVRRPPFEPRPRFGMFETIRAYAAEQLQAYGEAQLARHHHARHFTELAATSGPRVWAAGQAQTLDDLQLEHDNLRAAIEWLLDNRKLDEVARIASSLWLFWWIRGFHREAADWLATALESPAVMSVANRTQLLFVSGAMILAQGRYDLAGSQLDVAVHQARAGGDDSTLAFALVVRGHVALAAGDPDRAARAFEECQRVCRRRDEPYALALSHVGDLQVAIARGDFVRAHALVAAVDGETRDLGTPWVIAVALNARARLALAEDDASTVTTAMTEALHILARLLDRWAIRYPLAYLATAAAMQGRTRRAAMLYGVAEAFFERTGNVSTFPVPQRVSDRYRAEVEAELGGRAFGDLVERGRQLPVDEALAFASNDNDG